MKVRVLKQYTWAGREGVPSITYAPGDYLVGVDISEEAADGAIAAGDARRIPEKGERETKAVA